MRTATWIGGPWDGETIAIPDNLRHIEIPVPIDVDAGLEFLESVKEAEAFPTEPLMKRLVVPVLRTYDGRFLLNWYGGK